MQLLTSWSQVPFVFSETRAFSDSSPQPCLHDSNKKTYMLCSWGHHLPIEELVGFKFALHEVIYTSEGEQMSFGAMKIEAIKLPFMQECILTISLSIDTEHYWPSTFSGSCEFRNFHNIMWPRWFATSWQPSHPISDFSHISSWGCQLLSFLGAINFWWILRTLIKVHDGATPARLWRT